MSRSLEPSRLIAARGDVAIWDVGEGEPVLLMHGFPDHAIGLLDAAERFASEGYRAIVLAYPGYWPSSPVPDGDYSMSSVAGDIVRVLDALELPWAHVFGHGWGALYGYWLASHRPARVGRLVALAAPHPIGFRVRRRVLAEQQTAAYALLLAYSRMGPELAADRTWLTSLAQTWSPALWRADWPEILDRLTRPGVPEAVCGHYHADMEDEGTPVGVVQVPTTIIHGAQTGCLRPATFVDIDAGFREPPHRVCLPTVGHWPHLEAPEETFELSLAGLRAGRAAA
jgi:pimeloyl-ACP methyl ester carboxylesterase